MFVYCGCKDSKNIAEMQIIYQKTPIFLYVSEKSCTFAVAKDEWKACNMLVYNNVKIPALLVAKKSELLGEVELIEEEMWNLLIEKIWVRKN